MDSKDTLSNITIVLVGTSHPGNIGAVMRSMETMGFRQLILVKPKHFPHPDIEARASNAYHVMKNVKVVNTLPEALHGYQLVIASSARSRRIDVPMISARECGNLCLEYKQTKIAILFGPERTGLTNEQLVMSNYHVYVPANENYSALNIAAAVQVICYELRMANILSSEIKQKADNAQLAEFQEVDNFYQHLEEVLHKSEFIDRDNPRKLMSKVKRIFNRIKLEKNEVNILRGIINSISKL